MGHLTTLICVDTCSVCLILFMYVFPRSKPSYEFWGGLDSCRLYDIRVCMRAFNSDSMWTYASLDLARLYQLSVFALELTIQTYDFVFLDGNQVRGPRCCHFLFSGYVEITLKFWNQLSLVVHSKCGRSTDSWFVSRSCSRIRSPSCSGIEGRRILGQQVLLILEHCCAFCFRGKETFSFGMRRHSRKASAL